MVDKDRRPVYWLYFCTNHHRGLEEMKKAMSRVGVGFAFADNDHPDQMTLFASCDQEWLMQGLQKHFAGQEVSVRTVREYVLEYTPLANYAGVMQELQRLGKVVPINDRSRISYRDDLDRRVRFADLNLFGN